MARLLVGTSGWQFYDIANVFYPKTLHSRDFLRFYGERRSTVEVNSTFYRFSRATTFQKWATETPDDFLFALKANRAFTHTTPLEDPDGRLTEMFDSFRTLRTKAGPVLFQFPPSLHRDLRKLKSFCDRLPEDFRYVFELRHDSWHSAKVADLLGARGIALCAYDLKRKSVVAKPRADFAYVRLHGPLAAPYRGAYPDDELATWARFARRWLSDERDVFVYFDNTMRGDAITDALRFEQLVTDTQIKKRPRTNDARPSEISTNRT